MKCGLQVAVLVQACGCVGFSLDRISVKLGIHGTLLTALEYVSFVGAIRIISDHDDKVFLKEWNYVMFEVAWSQLWT